MAATSQITANLETILNIAPDVNGQVSIQLCGYGSQVPRVNGVAMLSQLEAIKLQPNASGQIQVTLFSNDGIVPAGTFYAFTFMNDNGDVVQTNAYRFIGFSSIDLALIDPYDPNQPPPPLPPLITNLLLIVAGDDDAHFDGSIYTAFKCTMTHDITGAYLSGFVPGNLYTFIIVQDAVGGHYFQWPSGPPPYNMHNATLVCPTPNSTTVQTFICDDAFDLWAIGPGTWNAL